MTASKVSVSGYLSTEDAVREIPVRDRSGNPLRLKTEGSIVPKGKSEQDRTPFKIGRAVWVQQSDYVDGAKVILIEELIWPDGTRHLRFGYRITTARTGS